MGKSTLRGATPRFSTDTTPGRWKVQVGPVNEDHWAQNALTQDNEEEAKAYAQDLLSRWTGADIARVVPVETPARTPIDLDDPAIVINYRKQR